MQVGSRRQEPQAGSCRQGVAGRELQARMQADSCLQGAAGRELQAGNCRQLVEISAS